MFSKKDLEYSIREDLKLEYSIREGLKICHKFFESMINTSDKTPNEKLNQIEKTISNKIRKCLSENFPGIPICVKGDEMLSTNLPSGEWIGFDPLDGFRNYIREDKYWGLSGFIMNEGEIVESVAFSYCMLEDPYRDWLISDDDAELLGKITRDGGHYNKIPRATYKRTIGITYSLSIPPDACKLDHCARYQKFLIENRLVNGEYGYGGIVADVTALLNATIDAVIVAGSYDVFSLAALKHLVESVNGTVVNEFGEKVIWTQRWHNLIFARDLKTASKFFMPR